ncbi:hypothetical protein GGX14DRAFT_594476 [Mycena pura]|uniref:Uncharacterized protein n=1 Tax=Mycena pura TaxID=153505 RepID=A0AAD6UQG2_9AGAR|nr:hypothetical protein GGX14DRAFT_594476 [Mycena pura]
MDAEILRLVEDTYYLGGPGVRDELVWRSIGGVNTLVAKAEEAEAKKEAAPLTFVALVSEPESNGKFRLNPDASWTGPMKFTKNFADVRLYGRAIKPSNIPCFADDFSTILQNVEWFMKETETPGYSKQGIFTENENPRASVNMRHVLFERTDPKEVEAMEKWPVYSDQARADLAKIKDTHRVLPLWAYGKDTKLIPPEEYREALSDAVVCATVFLKHWAYPPKGDEGGRDVYTADIQHLRVLSKLPITPKNRTPPPIDPGTPTRASKKARITPKKEST